MRNAVKDGRNDLAATPTGSRYGSVVGVVVSVLREIMPIRAQWLTVSKAVPSAAVIRRLQGAHRIDRFCRFSDTLTRPSPPPLDTPASPCYPAYGRCI